MELTLRPHWEYVADSVMGGVSRGRLTQETVQGRQAVRLSGNVLLDNGGGFVQIAFDLCPDGSAMDLSEWTGIEVDVLGNGEEYDLRLRTDQLTRPWQSFRTAFIATRDWTTQRRAFADFVPHRTEHILDPAHLRRIGLLAIGRAFEADVAIAAVRLYRA